MPSNEVFSTACILLKMRISSGTKCFSLEFSYHKLILEIIEKKLVLFLQEVDYHLLFAGLAGDPGGLDPPEL